MEFEPVEVRRDFAVWGTDDRAELLQSEEPFRGTGTRSVAAVVLPKDFSEAWQLCDDGVRLVGKTVGERLGLCPTVRFAAQVSPASCSSTLIDSDLILTAGHCVSDDSCAGLQFAFGVFLEADGGMAPLARNQLYGCRRLVSRGKDRDLALLQLDRPVAAPFGPARLEPEVTSLGAPLGVIGFPSGSPMKVAAPCHVLRVADAEQYLTNCDIFQGNSGSGVFAADGGGLLGVATASAGDWVPTDEGCRVPSQYDDAGRKPSLPAAAAQFATVTGVRDFISDLCAAGYPTAVCNRPPSCADGVCSGGETTASCAADCPAPRCGDGTCSFSEHTSCPADCGARDDASRCSGRAADAGTATPAPPIACGCAASSRGQGPGTLGPLALAWVALGVLRRAMGHRERATTTRGVRGHRGATSRG